MPKTEKEDDSVVGLPTPKPYTKLNDPSEISDEELEKMEEALKSGGASKKEESADEEGEAEELSAEEKVYKKRYGDLRAHYNEMVEKHKEVLAKKNDELIKARPEYSPPKNKEELAKFKEEYGDLYAIVQTLARQEAEEADSTIKSRLDAISEKEARLARQEAEKFLVNRHPDFQELIEDDEFHDWARRQDPQIQSWLYENTDNGVLAARAVDLYKTDKGIKAPKADNEKSDKAAAAQVVTKSRQSKPEGKEPRIWSESEVKLLKDSEYEKFEKEIDQALADGNFIFDLSR